MITPLIAIVGIAHTYMHACTLQLTYKHTNVLICVRSLIESRYICKVEFCSSPLGFLWLTCYGNVVPWRRCQEFWSIMLTGTLMGTWSNGCTISCTGLKIALWGHTLVHHHTGLRQVDNTLWGLTLDQYHTGLRLSLWGYTLAQHHTGLRQIEVGRQ